VDVVTTSEILWAWRDAYKDHWREQGIFPSAEGYADVVAQHRCGERASLSYGYQLSGDKTKDRQLRQAIRNQIDTIIAQKEASR